MFAAHESKSGIFLNRDDSMQKQMYLYLEPGCLLFWALNPAKEGLDSNQNKGHWGSRYIDK